MTSAHTFTYRDTAGNLRDESGEVVEWADSFDMADPEPPELPTSHLGKVLARSELAALPAVATLVDGVMSSPATVLMVGATGVGKSFTALALACCIATGRPWLGQPTVRRRVLFVIGEGASGLHKRLRAWEDAWNDGAPVADAWLTFVVRPDSLNGATTWHQLTGYAQSYDYGLVVLDTFSSLAPDADETKDAAQIIRRLSALSAAINGCALLVHHPGWSDSGRARGGYQLEANADEVLILENVDDNSGLFTMTRKKVKDGPAGKVHWLRRSPHCESVVIEGARPDDTVVPLRTRIAAVLSNYGDIGATGPQLMKELGVDDKARSGFYQALRKLRDDGACQQHGTGKAIRYNVGAASEVCAA